MRIEDYSKLIEKFTTFDSFKTAVDSEFTADFNDLYYPSSVATSYKAFVDKLLYAIYRFFKRDRLAYEDEDIFVERLSETLALNLNRYFEMKNIYFYLTLDTDTNKYVLTSKAVSSSNEKGKASSTNLQSSASTPTGVAPTDTGDTLTIKQSVQVDGTEKSEVSNDGFTDKYTNYQGKTNGFRLNDIARDGELTRVGSYINAIDMMNKLPKSFIDEVLHDTSSHFIFTY